MEKPKPSVIAIKAEVKKGLDELKVHPRETYSQVIERLITSAQVDKEFKGKTEEELEKEVYEEIKDKIIPTAEELSQHCEKEQDKEDLVEEKKSDNFSDSDNPTTASGA